MPKINVYLPDELAAAVKEAQLPVSTICQNALERAVLDVKAVRAAGGRFLEDGPLPEWGFMSRFSPRAMQALQVARDQAEAAPQDHVEPEHLLIGVLDDTENLAVRVVQALGVEPADVTAETIGSLPKPGKAAEGRTPFAAKTKAVLEVAVKEALGLGHNYIGCEHLLLGLVGVESIASEVLTRMGLDQRTLRRTVPSVLAGVVHARQAEARANAERSAVQPADLAAIVERLEAIERRLAG